MKTIEVRGEDQITESDEHKTSPAVATGNPASSQLLTLIAQQPFFKGLSGRIFNCSLILPWKGNSRRAIGFFGTD